jgi:bifunctional non-homologous end joining protein LigD
MLCESAERPPEGREWRYELKLDGFRGIGRKAGCSAQLWWRNQNDFTRRFPCMMKGIAELPNDPVIDGKSLRSTKVASPPSICSSASGVEHQQLCLYAFDLLMWCGKDVRLWPLEERREQLRQIIPHLPEAIRFSETFDVPLSELIREVRQHQLEGIVAKRAGSEVSLRCAFRRLVEVASESRPGVCDRRLHSEW